VFVHELTNRIMVSHNLHKNIYQALRTHHIDIPYPQHDIHLHSTVEPCGKDESLQAGETGL
jgi:potassium-dependent mechanosensitive channel